MNRLIILGLATTLGATYAAMQGTPVELQPTSPGTAQTGHLNISGTATVGILKSQNTVFGESTAPTGFAYGGYFTAASNQARGFYGYASSPTGLTYGGFFQNASDSGRAVYGLATSTTGFNYGGYFQTASTGGRGMLGVAAAPTGTTYGVYGTAVSPTGFGVYSDGNFHATGIISGIAASLSASSDTAIVTAHNTTTSAVNGHGVYGRSDSSLNGRGVFGFASALTGNTYGVRGESASSSGFGVYGRGRIGVLGSSVSTSGFGVYGTALAETGETHGGFFQSDSSSGKGVVGWATSATGNTYGVHGLADSGTNGIAVFGESEGTHGVYGLAKGTGYVYGVHGKTTSPFGVGVYGESRATTGTTTGVQGWTSSVAGRAIHGVASATSGSTFGGFFEGFSPLGYGVFATSRGTYGVWGESTLSSGFSYGGFFESASTSGRGVFATATAASSTTYGVRGSATSGSGFGVFSSGTFGASGTKAFRIDHPFNPENEYLLHYASESPEPLNVYTGNVTTDASGSAWVQLPDYFGEINKDFRYTLTVVDDTDSEQFVMAKVAKKVQGNRFKIRTSAPKIEVTWRVEGVRNDLWVRKYGAPTEVAKDGIEKGKYQHPELYGKPKEMGMDYRPKGVMSSHGSPREQDIKSGPVAARRQR